MPNKCKIALGGFLTSFMLFSLAIPAQAKGGVLKFFGKTPKINTPKINLPRINTPGIGVSESFPLTNHHLYVTPLPEKPALDLVLPYKTTPYFLGESFVSKKLPDDILLLRKDEIFTDLYNLMLRRTSATDTSILTAAKDLTVSPWTFLEMETLPKQTAQGFIDIQNEFAEEYLWGYYEFRYGGLWYDFIQEGGKSLSKQSVPRGTLSPSKRDKEFAVSQFHLYGVKQYPLFSIIVETRTAATPITKDAFFLPADMLADFSYLYFKALSLYEKQLRASLRPIPSKIRLDWQPTREDPKLELQSLSPFVVEELFLDGLVANYRLLNYIVQNKEWFPNTIDHLLANRHIYEPEYKAFFAKISPEADSRFTLDLTTSPITPNLKTFKSSNDFINLYKQEKLPSMLAEDGSFAPVSPSATAHLENEFAGIYYIDRAALAEQGAKLYQFTPIPYPDPALYWSTNGVGTPTAPLAKFSSAAYDSLMPTFSQAGAPQAAANVITKDLMFLPSELLAQYAYLDKQAMAYYDDAVYEFKHNVLPNVEEYMQSNLAERYKDLMILSVNSSYRLTDFVVKHQEYFPNTIKYLQENAADLFLYEDLLSQIAR